MSEQQKDLNPTDAQYRVGECPGCRVGVYAEAVLVADLSTPHFTPEGLPAVSAKARVVGVKIDHSCGTAAD